MTAEKKVLPCVCFVVVNWESYAKETIIPDIIIQLSVVELQNKGNEFLQQQSVVRVWGNTHEYAWAYVSSSLRTGCAITNSLCSIMRSTGRLWGSGETDGGGRMLALRQADGESC